MKIAFDILFVLLFTALLLSSGQYLKLLKYRLVQNDFLNWQIQYQLLLLSISAMAILTSFWLNPQGLQEYLAIGNLSAPAKELLLFGIAEGDNWIETGLSLSVIITGITVLFLYVRYKNSGLQPICSKKCFGWILLFALSNAFGEEIIYRLAIIAPLSGMINSTQISLISAVIFGLAHFRGVPGGPVGVLLSGLLGFVLAKSVLETHGLFWAVCIHFLQDVPIMLLMSRLRPARLL